MVSPGTQAEDSCRLAQVWPAVVLNRPFSNLVPRANEPEIPVTTAVGTAKDSMPRLPAPYESVIHLTTGHTTHLIVHVHDVVASRDTGTLVKLTRTPHIPSTTELGKYWGLKSGWWHSGPDRTLATSPPPQITRTILVRGYLKTWRTIQRRRRVSMLLVGNRHVKPFTSPLKDFSEPCLRYGRYPASLAYAYRTEAMINGPVGIAMIL